MKAFFAALLVLLASLQLAAAQCSNNGFDFGGGVCSCYSGFTGADCSTDGSAGCTLPTVAPLATQVIAEFMGAQSSISANDFTFVIESAATDMRYFSSISLNGGGENCSYPGPLFTKAFLASPTCKDSFTGVFSIAELHETCGFAESSEPGFTILSGDISVSAVDNIGTFRGHPITRTTTSALTVNLKLPTFVNLTTSELEIDSPIDVLAAVTYQAFDKTTGIATIKVTVSAQWPYTFSNSVPSGNHPYTYDSSSTDIDCPSTPGSSCLQEITFTIADILPSCNFDGEYALALTYGCRSGMQTPCPVSGLDVSTVHFNLTSEDICGSVGIEAHIQGEIKSYSDNTFATERVVIVAGQTINLHIVLTSDVTIESILIQELRIVQQGKNPLVLVSNGNAQAPYDSEIQYNDDDFSTPPTGFNDRALSFLATYGTTPGSIFDSSVADAVFTFTIEVDLVVTYKTTFSKKRDVSSSNLSLVAQGVFVASQL